MLFGKYRKSLVFCGFVRELYDKEIKAFVYTANEPQGIKNIKEMDVDGIYSEYPDRL